MASIYDQYRRPQKESPITAFARGALNKRKDTAERAQSLERIGQESEMKLKGDPRNYILNKISKKVEAGTATEKEKQIYNSQMGVKEETAYGASGVSQLGRNKLLGTLESGFYVHPIAGKMPVKTKEAAIDYLQQSGYQSYEQDPELMSVLEALPSKYQQEEEETNNLFKDLIGGVGEWGKKHFGKADTSDKSRDQATKILTDNGQKVTDKNIEYVLKNMGA